jgi:hypothetical protein
MTHEEESAIAQQVLSHLAGQGAPTNVRGARVRLAGSDYIVHRHGNDLRFHQKANLYGSAGNYLIVSVGQHKGGWMLARAVRPPGEYHDDRAAEAARGIVERALASLGRDVGTSGIDGRQKTPRELEADVRAYLDQNSRAEPPVRRQARRARRR